MLGFDPLAGKPLAAISATLPSGIVPERGLFVLTGNAVDLYRNRTVVADVGGFTLSGQSVGFILSISQASFYRTLLVGSTAARTTGFKMITNFMMVAGDSKTLVISVKDAEGVAVNITDATVKWRAARSFGKTAVISKLTDSGIQITDGPNGQFTVTLDPTDTDELKGTYYHEAEVTFSDGTISTVLSGTMKINPALIAT